MKGTNGIYSGTVGYLSRRGIQNKLIIYGLIASKPEGSTKHGFLSAGRFYGAWFL